MKLIKSTFDENNCYFCTYKNVLNENCICYYQMYDLGICFGEFFNDFKCLDYINDGVKDRYMVMQLFLKRNL